MPTPYRLASTTSQGLSAYATYESLPEPMTEYRNELVRNSIKGVIRKINKYIHPTHDPHDLVKTDALLAIEDPSQQEAHRLHHTNDFTFAHPPYGDQDDGENEETDHGDRAYAQPELPAIEPARASTAMNHRLTAYPNRHSDDEHHPPLRVSRSYGAIETTHIDPQPIEYIAKNSDNYQYILPSFPPPADDEIRRRIDNFILFRNRRQAAKALPLPVGQRREEVVYMTKDEATRTYKVGSRPWAPLEAGLTIVCVGDMVGEWKTTNRVIRSHGKVFNLWENDESEQKTYVQVNEYFQLPPTLATRIKARFGQMKKALFASRKANLNQI
ncbi:hypothetical protein FB451DRAFT_1200811 [Mycena latifolia]|nr:hypothetical protein FB451DRAFT_1200811 [Mycena latifolia]